MCYQFFRKESTLFTPKNTRLETILATSLANFEDDSLDGDSIFSQSRFDAYADFSLPGGSKREKCLPLVMADCHRGPFPERMRLSPLLETARKYLNHFASCAR